MVKKTQSIDGKNPGKNVEFHLIEYIFSEFFEKLKVSDLYRKSENSDYKQKSENFYNP